MLKPSGGLLKKVFAGGNVGQGKRTAMTGAKKPLPAQAAPRAAIASGKPSGGLATRKPMGNMFGKRAY